MSGYKVCLQNGGGIAERFLCAHCELVMKDPVQTRKTGERYCKECYNKAPRDPANPEQKVWDDNAIKKEIAKLSVKCPYHDRGCSWSGKLKQRDEHAAVCCHVERDVVVSVPSSCSSVENKPIASEQMEMEADAQEQSVSTDYIGPFPDNGGQSLPYPPVVSRYPVYSGTSAFQGWATTQIDKIRDNGIRINDQIVQLHAANASTYDGKIIWPIPKVHQKIQDAQCGRISNIYSPPFYTGRYGYKMCITAYLNGDGTGKGTHLSIFFVLMKSEYDPLLQWPFDHKVSLILMDQDHKKDIIRTLKPDMQSSSFQRPKTDMKIVGGFTKFALVSIYKDANYVRDDVMYIKAVVDTSKIAHP